MKLIIGLTFLVITFFTYCIYVSQVDIRISPLGHRALNPPSLYDYKGIFNVRTLLSNGSSSHEEIIQEAKAVDLDFIVFTDLNKYDFATSASGYHGSLLAMDEGEYPFLDSRLLYISGQKPLLPSDPAQSQVYFTDLLSQANAANREGLLILAHPFNPHQTWIGPFPTGLDGIEILNPRAVSQDGWVNSKLSTIWSLIVFPFNYRYSFLRMFREPTSETGLWDQLNADQNLAGYAGADASARAIPFADYLIKFPSYQKSFEIVSNHVLLSSELTGSAAKDKMKILKALKARNFYISLDLAGDPKGFNSVVKEKEKTYLMGSKFKFAKGQKIHVNLPYKPDSFFEIILLKDGERAAISNQEAFVHELKGPGTYRVVVRVCPDFPFPEGKRWLTWIYSNPFFITP